MGRVRIDRFGSVPAVVTIVALLPSLCVDAVEVKKRQMGGSIQGVPLSLSGTISTLPGITLAGSHDHDGQTARYIHHAGITTDGSSLYLAESDNHRIRKIAIATGAATTVAGTTGSPGGTDGVGGEARFHFPQGITTDGAHLYVADTSNHTIRKVVIATGKVTTVAGKAGTHGAADGTGAGARFRHPHGITTDGATLYVADSFNNAIRKVEIATGEVATLCGTAGSRGWADGTGAAARFDLSFGITTDGTNLYVADECNHTVRKVAIATGVVITLAGTAKTPGLSNGTRARARFKEPTGITTDGTSLYVTDAGNNTIRKID